MISLKGRISIRRFFGDCKFVAFTARFSCSILRSAYQMKYSMNSSYACAQRPLREVSKHESVNALPAKACLLSPSGLLIVIAVTDFCLDLIAYTLLTNMLIVWSNRISYQIGFHKSPTLRPPHMISIGPNLRVSFESYPRTSVTVFGVSPANKLAPIMGCKISQKALVSAFGDMSAYLANVLRTPYFPTYLILFLFSAWLAYRFMWHNHLKWKYCRNRFIVLEKVFKYGRGNL